MAPEVVTNGDKFEIYRRNGSTPLVYEEDPNDLIDVDPVTAQGPLPNPPDGRSKPSNLDDVEEYEKAIHEVYGPTPAQRLHIDETSSRQPLQTAERVHHQT